VLFFLIFDIGGNLMRKSSLIIALLLTAGSPALSASALEIKAFFPVTFQHTAAEVIPQFEQSSGNKVAITYGTAGAVAAKVSEGAVADVVISTSVQIENLSKQGKVVAGSKAEIAKVGFGVLVRKGAPKPDISSVAAFKSSILAAKAISYTDPALGAPGGIYVSKLMDQLGIGAEMKAKTKLSGAGAAAVNTTVVNGEADVGFFMINEIVVDPRVDYVGPLPAPIQSYTQFAGGLVSASDHKSAGQALLKMMTSDRATEVMKKLGFEVNH
jgi:molybdate transport system substrate-binding protein